MTTPDKMTDARALADLQEVMAYFDQRSDVVDGDYGAPSPNQEMTLLISLEDAYSHIERRLSAAAVPEATGTVADYSDSELVRRAVRTICHRRKQPRPAWGYIAEVFALGSTYSAQLCRRFGIDPDTGKDAAAPTPEGGE